VIPGYRWVSWADAGTAFSLEAVGELMGAPESYRHEVTERVESGWRIEEETAERVTLVKRSIGSAKTHLLIAVLTIWWAMGVPNLLYGAYKYVADAEQTIVWKGEPVVPSTVDARRSGSDR
jgi:hypothetical protein